MNRTERIWALSAFWAEARETYPYFERLPLSRWDEAYRAWLPKLAEEEDELEAEFRRIKNSNDIAAALNHVQGLAGYDSGAADLLGRAFKEISAAVGMAMAARLTGRDYRVYGLLGDGELEEGQVWEAAMFAGFRKLDNLCVIVDNNGLQIDGPVDKVCSPYPIDEKFKAFNFHVINIDGHNFDEIRKAFEEARNTKGQPTAIVAHTTKGKGVSFMENQVGWHGKAPNDEEFKLAMEELERTGAEL